KIGEWADAGDASLKAMEPVSSGAWPDEYALETARVVAERMSVGGMLDPARNLMEHARRRMGEEAWRNAPEWARVQARIDLSAGRLEEAASALSRIPSEARARDAGWLELEAAILKSQGNLISAAEVYARAIRLLRGDAQSGARIAELEMAVAGCHLDMNQPHQALSACKSLLNRAELSDARRAEATRLAIRAALAADVVPDMQRYARMYLQMIREPEATPEEARWMLAASRKAQEAGDQDVAAKLARTAMIAGRNAEVKDHAFWADVREAHAQALPATRARAWMDALESLRLLGMSHQDISPSGIRVRLLLARIAREQGEPARAAFYHSEALAIAALPGLNTDPGVAGLVRAAMANPDHGNQMPAAVGNSADHQRYEAAAAMIR
nr:hypothetical protein [Kiritimatiellia bacterium]